MTTLGIWWASLPERNVGGGGEWDELQFPPLQLMWGSQPVIMVSLLHYPFWSPLTSLNISAGLSGMSGVMTKVISPRGLSPWSPWRLKLWLLHLSIYHYNRTRK